MEGGPTALADYELLELLLGQAQPRRDMKPIAKALLKRFGSFAGVMAASPDALADVDDVGDASIVTIKAIQAAALLMQQQDITEKPVLASWKSVLAYCHSVMAHEPTEQFRLLFLDTKNALIKDEIQSRGTVNHTPVYVREVAKRALALDASAVIMAHNHPSGDPSPSRDDIEMTKAVKVALEKIGIQLHDHIIVGRKGHVSLRSLGYIDGTK